MSVHRKLIQTLSWALSMHKDIRMFKKLLLFSWLVSWIVSSFLLSIGPNEIQFHMYEQIVTIQATHNQYIIQKFISKIYIEK